MRTLDLSNQGLTVLPDLPDDLQELYVSDNQLTSLPLTLPSDLQVLYMDGNLGLSKYTGLSINQIHDLLFQERVDLFIRHRSAKKIQKTWQHYWYEQLDPEGVSRFARSACVL